MCIERRDNRERDKETWIKRYTDRQRDPEQQTEGLRLCEMGEKQTEITKRGKGLEENKQQGRRNKRHKEL